MQIILYAGEGKKMILNNNIVLDYGNFFYLLNLINFRRMKISGEDYKLFNDIIYLNSDLDKASVDCKKLADKLFEKKQFLRKEEVEIVDQYYKNKFLKVIKTIPKIISPVIELTRDCN